MGSVIVTTILMLAVSGVFAWFLCSEAGKSDEEAEREFERWNKK